MSHKIEVVIVECEHPYIASLDELDLKTHVPVIALTLCNFQAETCFTIEISREYVFRRALYRHFTTSKLDGSWAYSSMEICNTRRPVNVFLRLLNL